MTNDRLTFTKAIRGGKLRATEMEVGDSIQGVLKGFKPGKFGSNAIFEIKGNEVEVYSAGNLKFLEADVTKGRFTLGVVTTVTRVDDIQTNAGFTSTQFEITQNVAKPATTAPNTQQKIRDILANQRNKNVTG